MYAKEGTAFAFLGISSFILQATNKAFESLTNLALEIDKFLNYLAGYYEV